MINPNVFGIALVKINQEPGGPIDIEIEQPKAKVVKIKVGIREKKKFLFNGGYMLIKPRPGTGDHMLTAVNVG